MKSILEQTKDQIIVGSHAVSIETVQINIRIKYERSRNLVFSYYN